LVGQRRKFEVPQGWVARGWRFEVEPTTTEQSQLIARHFGARRFAYNWALAQVKANLDARTADPQVAPLAWDLPALRRIWNQAKQTVAPWWPECSKETYSCGIADLVAALRAWSDSKHGRRAGGRVGFPRFKARHRDHGRVRFTTGAMRLEADRRHLTLPVVGKLRAKENTRRLQRLITKGRARILSMTLAEQGGRLFVSVSTIVCQVPGAPREPQSRCGIDLGIGREWAVIAHDNGSIQRVAHPAPWTATHKQRRRVARQLSRRLVGSQGYRQAKTKLAALDRRAANLRTNQVHTLTTTLSRRYGTVVVEDLDLAAMGHSMGRRAFRRSVYQAGLGTVRPILSYKCAWAGSQLVVADRWFASSKTHHGCGGYVTDLQPGDRVWVCPECRQLVDRNANAARNLRDWTGLASPIVATTATGMSSVGVVDAPVPLVGDHGGQAHVRRGRARPRKTTPWVARADDTKTKSPRLRGQGTPSRGTSQRADTDAH
jgi:putative transposase